MTDRAMRAAALVRLVLTLSLLAVVYRETGPFTTMTLGLMVVGFEVQLRLLKGDAR